jgi:tetratricopeptide (TPR) repeat protein
MTRGPLRSAGLLLLAAWMWAGAVVPARAQPEVERVRTTAKTLFFDRKYAEARQAWEAVRAAKGPDAEAAAYWVARCSENLGERDRALKEYDAFLALGPKDRALTDEARTSRVGLASKLYKAGRKDRAQVLRDALRDPSKTVRYYAALQMAGLDAEMGKLAAPVLRRIVEQEKDTDLVDRAKVGLLRWDPAALGRVEPPARTGPGGSAGVSASATARSSATGGSSARAAGGGEARWVHIRITDKGGSKPKVSINLPLGLAEMLYKALPDDAKADLRRKGYDATTFWDSLRKLGPSEILSIEGDEGERIEIWTE